MLAAASLLLVAIVAAPLETLVFRTVARPDEQTPALLRVAGLYCYLLIPIIAACLAAVIALSVSSALGVSGRVWAIEVLAVGFLPATSVFALSVVQARQDLSKFAWLAGTSVVTLAVSKLLLVVIWPLSVVGWVISDLVSAVISAVAAIILVRLPRAQITRIHLRETLRFALPLIPHRASIWAVMSLSRPALAAVSSLAQVGMLSFALNLASIASLILSEVNRSVLPRYSRETFRAPTHETLNPVRMQLFAAFVVPAIVGCGVAIAGRWLFSTAYWPAFALTGVLLVGQVAFGLYLIPMNFLTQTAGRPKYSSIASGTGAIVILGSILLFGQRFGAAGVAYATSVGFSGMAALAMVLTFTHKLDIAWMSWLEQWPEIGLAAVGLCFTVAALAMPLGSTSATLFAVVAILVITGATITALRRGARE